MICPHGSYPDWTVEKISGVFPCFSRYHPLENTANVRVPGVGQKPKPLDRIDV